MARFWLDFEGFGSGLGRVLESSWRHVGPKPGVKNASLFLRPCSRILESLGRTTTGVTLWLRGLGHHPALKLIDTNSLASLDKMARGC